MQNFLDRFLNPKSVAIIGATQNPFSVNYHLVNNLLKLGYKGRIYPVNPRSEDIIGLKTYKSFSDIGEYVDLVVISVPARNVLDVVRDLPADKVGAVVLVAGGFAEIGEEGKATQDEIKKILKEKAVRTIGPNALSPINSRSNLAVSFFPLNELPAGNVSFIFQSGLYEPRFNWLLQDFHLGLSKLIDLGNKMDINEVEVLEYLSQDTETEVIGIHLEIIKGDGRRFFELLKETSRRKPVIVLKGGRTEAGARAAMSHTGSLVRGNEAVFDAALKQAGAIKAETLDDFFYLAKAFSFLKPPRGNRVALATFPGGEAVLSTDACLKNGLVLARPSEASYERLKGSLPPWKISLNPYDFGIIYTFHGLVNNHGAFIEAMADDDNVDCMAVQLPPMGFPVDAEMLCMPFLTAAKKGKPLVTWPPHMLKMDTEINIWLETHSIPVFPSAVIAIRCLAALYQYGLRSGPS